MRLLKIIMPLLVLLIGSTAAHAQDEGVVYTLTKRCIPADAVSGYPSSDTYTAGTSVYLNAYAKTGFSFVRWEDEEGNEISTSNGFYYTMPSQDVILIARFEYNPDSPAEPTVPEIKKMANVFFEAYPADGGSTSQSGEYEVGTEIYVSASSASGFRFINWTKNDEVINTYSSFYYTVEEGDQTLAAHFQYDPSSPSEPSEPVFHRNLTLKANPANAVSSFSGDGGHINGSTFTVSATVAPNVYYTFDNWTDENGDIVSETLSFSYTMPNRNSTLTANFRYDFNPPSPDEPGAPSIDDQGIVGKPRMTMQDDTHVLILCATPGATIHYTLDGTEPTTASDVYTDAVFVPGNIIVKAIAVKEGMTDSQVTTYQVTSYHAAMPVIFFESGKIKMTSATEGAAIHYTIDNKNPSADSPVYSAPLDAENDVIVKALASHEGLTDSDIAVYIFKMNEHVMEAPVLTLNEDLQLVITPAVEAGTIRYTLDGTDPDATSTEYSGPVTLTQL